MQKKAKKKKKAPQKIEKRGDNAKKATDFQATAIHSTKKYMYTYSYFKIHCLSTAR